MSRIGARVRFHNASLLQAREGPWHTGVICGHPTKYKDGVLVYADSEDLEAYWPIEWQFRGVIRYITKRSADFTVLPSK